MKKDKKGKKAVEVTKVEQTAAPLAPASKGKKAIVVHMRGEGAPTLCGNWNPKATITDDARLVSCKTCVAAMSPKAKAKKERKPPVQKVCGCGVSFEVPASQAHSVTRCPVCRKKHLKAKRKEKGKARKARKHGTLRHAACDILATIAQQEGVTEDVLRTLATIIRETYPKAKKG